MSRNKSTASSRLPDRIPADVASKLGWYVYLYVNPLNNEVFYIGKGKGQRAIEHLKDNEDSKKVETIRRIHHAREEPRIEILAHNLRDENTAFQVEAAAIELIGISNLSNKIRGKHSSSIQCCRVNLLNAILHYQCKKVNINEPGILIRITWGFRSTMSMSELYDATRGIWRVSESRGKKAKYAFAISEGIIREVYEITQWFPAGSTFNSRDCNSEWSDEWEGERMEFVGRLAPERIRKKYVNGNVSHMFETGNRNPISYVNI